MHRYISHTDGEIKEMLAVIGADNVDALFDDIPQEIRKQHFDLPKPLSEAELMAHAKELARCNTSGLTCYLGAGAYDHYIPAVIDSLISRQEFYTAYTPYQPEISQGTLQAIFEFQTMICALTGMDVANASMYDGATAAAEAMNVACSATRRSEVLVAHTVHPQTRKVVDTYAKGSGKTVVSIGMKNGQVDTEDLNAKLSDRTAAVILQTPNFFGALENIGAIASDVHDHKALLIVCADPMTLGTLEAPRKLGADIVVGEAQTLGSPLNFGGPYVGYFATTKKLMRKSPGRLVGQTVDADGKRAFVLTIQTREQHIRREKATSNICSNQALNALISCIYMAAVGKQGIKEVGDLCVQKSHYAYDRLIETGCFEPVFDAPFFKEFTLRYKGDLTVLRDKLRDNGILFGYDLSADFSDMNGCCLVAVTEKRTKEQIDTLVDLVKSQEVSA